MENRFKLKLARLFRSCKSKNFSTDVIDDINTGFPDPPQNPQHKHGYQLFEHLSSKPRTFPSFFRPKFSQTSKADTDGHKCPPTSPILPPYHEFSSCGSKPRPEKHRKNKKMKKKKNRNHIRRLDFDDFPAFEYKGLFSSDEEENKEDDRSALFSSRSFSLSSSDSSGSLRWRGATAATAVKDSFAVVKRSSDPYGDFRASMLEMILEKQLFGARDLEKLLECFLSLNSDHHHGIIIEVFTEICEALLSAGLK